MGHLIVPEGTLDYVFISLDGGMYVTQMSSCNGRRLLRKIVIIIILVITFMQDIYNSIHLKQTMFLGYIVLQLFCIYSLCYL